MRLSIAAISAICLASAVSVYAQVNLPNTFVAGSTARASEVNANFEALRDAINDLSSIAVTTSDGNVVELVSDTFEVLRLDTTVAGSRPWAFGITDNGIAGACCRGAGSLLLGNFVDGATTGVGGGSFFTQFAFTPDGEFAEISDSRLKTNIIPLSKTLDKLDKIRGVSFEWKVKDNYQSKRRQIGVIAQEVEEVFPELVVTSGDEGYKMVEYAKLSSVLIEAVKELRSEKDAQIAELQARLKKLEQTAGIAPLPIQSSILSSSWLLFSGLFLAGMAFGQRKRLGNKK